MEIISFFYSQGCKHSRKGQQQDYPSFAVCPERKLFFPILFGKLLVKPFQFLRKAALLFFVGAFFYIKKLTDGYF